MVPEKKSHRPEGEITCVCGSTIMRKNISIHEKSLKHKRAVGLIPPVEKKGGSKSKVPEPVPEEYDDEEDENDPEFDELVKNMNELREDVWDVQETLDNLVDLISQAMFGDDMVAEENEDAESNTDTLRTEAESADEKEEKTPEVQPKPDVPEEKKADEPAQP
jgi:hypothetical protein